MGLWVTYEWPRKTREIVKIRLDKIKEDEKNDFEVTGGVEIEKKNALLKE